MAWLGYGVNDCGRCSRPDFRSAAVQLGGVGLALVRHLARFNPACNLFSISIPSQGKPL